MTRRVSLPGHDAYDQAAEWFVRLGRGALSRGDRRAFEHWYADPDNAAAYAAVERSWHLAGQAAAGESTSNAARRHGMIESARAGGARRRPRWLPAEQSSAKANLVRTAAATALAIVTGALLWSAVTFSGRTTSAPDVAASQPAPPETYVTAVGERSTVTLRDGSQVSLNTDSRLRVSYSASTRRLELLAGQALFEVTTDAQRPFIVVAGNHQVVALGTAFDVRLDAQTVQVTLIEGSVSVEGSAPDGKTGRATRLDPGQQFRADGPEAPEVRHARLEQVTSWREGRLIFSDEPLAQAVAEVNRYSTRKIVLDDATLAALRVSGVFHTGRPDSFVEALTNYFGIVAAADPASGGIVLRPEDRGSSG